MDQALNSQKTPHTSPLRASYGMSFVSILMKNDRVIKGFYCIIFCDKLQAWRYDFLWNVGDMEDVTLNSLRPSEAYMCQKTDHHWFR